MRVLYAIGLLLFINAQVNRSSATLDKADKSFEEGFEKLTNESTVSQNYKAEHPADEQSELMRCNQKRIIQLHMLDKTSIHDFFKCVRMKQGFKKIAEILGAFIKIGDKLNSRMFALFISCVDLDSVTGSLCLANQIIDFLTDFKSYVPEFHEQEPLIRQWAKDISESFNYCAKYKDEHFDRRLSDIYVRTDISTSRC